MPLVYVNVAVLLIQRGSRRTRTGGARRSGQPVALAQLLTETAVIAALAGVAGWLASVVLARGMLVPCCQMGMSFVFNAADFRILPLPLA